MTQDDHVDLLVAITALKMMVGRAYLSSAASTADPKGFLAEARDELVHDARANGDRAPEIRVKLERQIRELFAALRV